MSAQWIYSRLNDALYSGQIMGADANALQSVLNTGPVFAGVVAVNLKGNSNESPYIAIQVHVYQGQNKFLKWNKIFWDNPYAG